MATASPEHKETRVKEYTAEVPEDKKAVNLQFVNGVRESQTRNSNPGSSHTRFKRSREPLPHDRRLRRSGACGST